MTIIMGYGPNNLAIPLVICESEASARDYLDEIGLVPNAKGVYELPESLPDSVVQGLFKYHYFGCGTCYEVKVLPASFDTPLICWGLN